MENLPSILASAALSTWLGLALIGWALYIGLMEIAKAIREFTQAIEQIYRAETRRDK